MNDDKVIILDDLEPKKRICNIYDCDKHLERIKNSLVELRNLTNLLDEVVKTRYEIRS